MSAFTAVSDQVVGWTGVLKREQFVLVVVTRGLQWYNKLTMVIKYWSVTGNKSLQMESPGTCRSFTR